MKRHVWLGVLCGAVSLAAPGLARAEDEYVIGLAYGGTGPYATSSRTTETAVDIAVREINDAGGVGGKKIRLAKFDTAGNPQQAALAVRRFAQDDGALAVIGPFATAEVRVGFPVAEREAIVALSNSSTVPGVSKGFRYAYRLTTDDGLAFSALVKVMKEKGIPANTAAVMYVSDDAGMKIAGTEVYPRMLAAAGVKLVGDPVGFTYAAFDLAPQVAKIIPNKPDVLMVAGVVEPALKSITELRRQGYQGRMIGSLFFADPDLARKMGPAGDGTIYVTWFYSEASDAARKFTQAFNAENAKRGIDKSGPHHVDASAYDAVYLLVQAIKEAHLTGDKAKLAQERTALRDEMERIRFSGVSGDTHFNQDHDAVLPFYVIEIRNGKAQLLGTVRPAG
jgi:branched-chain amino acid transport system substrate-binding protein